MKCEGCGKLLKQRNRGGYKFREKKSCLKCSKIRRGHRPNDKK